jgi:transcriptional regulator with XRE-family HTH domain
MVTSNRAKDTLRERGWSLRRAAEQLGVTHVHLSYVLQGRRESRRIMAAIERLGPSPVAYRESGFARRRVA